MSQVIRLRRGSEAQWSSANPTLAAGELGIATDSHRIKAGDGSTAWNSLAWSDTAGQTTIAGLVVVDADYEVADSDVVVIATAACTVTLPTAVYAGGRLVHVKSSATGTVTVTGTETIDDVASIALKTWEAVTVVSDDAQWVIL